MKMEMNVGEDVSDIQQIDTTIDMNPPTLPKQYLLMVDEITMAFMSKIFSTMQFVEITAMPIKDNDAYQLLANPKSPPPQKMDETSPQ